MIFAGQDPSKLFVIYNIETGKRMGRMYEEKTYSTKGAAKSALTVAVRNGKVPAGKYTVTDLKTFNEVIDTEVEVINMMSKKPVKIRKSEVGTCTDPSTERYWTM